MNSHTPIISYFRRYWWIVALIYPLYLFARAEAVWRVLDVFAYFPLVLCVIASVALLFRNIFHKRTTDADVDSGNYAKWYREELSRSDRVKLVTYQWIAYIIAGAIIGHGLLMILAGLPNSVPS